YRFKHNISPNLQVREQAQASHTIDQQAVGDGQEICGDDQAVIGRKGGWALTELEIDPHPERQAHDGNPDSHEPFELEAKRVQSCRRTACQPMAEAILKIGRYMAMTINPMMVPRNTISMGSIREVMAETAASTSSS